MKLSDAELAAVKRYMQIDADDTTDDDLISALYTAAQLYLNHAGIERNEDNGALYDLAVHALTLFYYDNRNAVDIETDYPAGLGRIITQMKLTATAE